MKTSTAYDRGIPVEGVAIHLVDQPPDACPKPVKNHCVGLHRRIAPVTTGRKSAVALGHVLQRGCSSETLRK